MDGDIVFIALPCCDVIDIVRKIKWINYRIEPGDNEDDDVDYYSKSTS